MLAEERRNRLLELVRVRRFASLPELGRATCRSPNRRSAATWSTWKSRAPRGGSTAACFTPAVRPSCRTSTPSQPAEWEQKKAIAAEAVELIEDGDTILLDGGSTTYEVARLLVGRPLHVVTNSLPVANLFASDANSDLVLIGGNICPRTGVARGPYADADARHGPRAEDDPQRGRHQRRGLFQQQPAAGRDRAGDDAGGRRSDRRGRQHEVRPPEPDPPLPAGRRRTTWSSTTASADRVAQRRSPPPASTVASSPDARQPRERAGTIDDEHRRNRNAQSRSTEASSSRSSARSCWRRSAVRRASRTWW